MAREIIGTRRFVGRAPGRIDVMGGLSAYTGGLAVESTTREAVWTTVEIREDRQILILSPQMRERGQATRAEFCLDDLTDAEHVRQLVNAATNTRWTAYVLGALFLLKEWFPDRFTAGANIYIKSELPLNRSAGATAAVEVSVMKASARAYGIELSGVELAKACQWVENVIAESACGAVDQMASVLGEEASLLPLVCQDCTPQPLIRLSDRLRLWGVSASNPAAEGTEQETARAAVFMAYKLVCELEGALARFDESGPFPRWTDPRWNGYLSIMTPSLFRSNYEQRLPETLTGADFLRDGQAAACGPIAVRPELNYRVRACARFAVDEHQRARLWMELARAGVGFEEMGELMYQSHYGYTECGLGCEAADYLVSLVCEEGAAGGLYGAKITGGGAGGIVAVLGSPDGEPALLRVVERYTRLQGETPYVFAGSSMGADRFGVLALER